MVESMIWLVRKKCENKSLGSLNVCYINVKREKD